MKNIHILLTEKPSRFSLNSSGKYHLTNQLHTNSPNFTNQHIYITNDEDIKDGDYAYHKIFGVGKIINIYGEDCFVTIRKSQTDGSVTTPWKRNIPDIKKIILTTNPDLVVDGVQAIDDEFLEWFTKNPSCEYVEVKHKFDEDWSEESGAFEIDYYKIIIPKEEPKQELNFYERLVEYFKTTPREKVLEDWKKSEQYDLIGQTVEETAEMRYPINSTGGAMEMIKRDDYNNYLKQEGGVIAENILDEDGLIRAEKIDGISRILNEEFDRLLDIEIQNS